MGQLRRRQFLGLVGAGFAVWPAAAPARKKPAPRIRKLGFLTLDNADTEFFLSGLTTALRDLGYGDDALHVEVRSAENAAGLLALAAELMALKVDLVFAFQTPAAIAAKQAVHEIPVVFLAADPVASGLVGNLSRPGGNVTGVSAAVSELAAKNLELIRELMPTLKHVAVLTTEGDSVRPTFVERVEAAARPFAIEVDTVLLRSAAEPDAGLETMLRKSEAILVQPGIARQPVAELALRLKLPAVSPNPSFVNAGGLASYSADFGEVPRRCAAMIVEILKGNRPGNLPVELPDKFWLVLNLKTAKQLGLDVTQSFQMRADQLIE